MKKYKYTGKEKIWLDHKLHRIVALRDFGDVKKGDVGGWIERHSSLSHEGNCWVYDDSKVYWYAEIRDNAKVKGMSSVFNFAQVFDNAVIKNKSYISDHARAFGNAIVIHSFIYQNAWIFENAEAWSSSIFGLAMLYGNTKIDYKNIDNGHHAW